MSIYTSTDFSIVPLGHNYSNLCDTINLDIYTPRTNFTLIRQFDVCSGLQVQALWDVINSPLQGCSYILFRIFTYLFLGDHAEVLNSTLWPT